MTLTIVDKNGCEADASILIRVLETQIFVPNVFSPNGDGVNDYFTVYGNSDQIEIIESMDIFDRWGNLVFESTNMTINVDQEGWDGTFGGSDVNPGVFAFISNIRLVNGEAVQLIGSITLIR